MKERSKLIQECVDKAKKYLLQVENIKKRIGVYQADIAELALKVCDIRHGGRSDKLYTIKDFAGEIGVKGRTLQNWVATYRTVVPVVGRDKIKTSKDWSDVIKTKRTTGSTSCNKSVKEIFSIYNNGDEKPFLAEFRNSIAAAKHLKYMLTTRDLNLIEMSQWSSLMAELDICSDLINDYLTNKKTRRAQ